MKTFRLFAVFAFAAIFAVSAFAQAPAAGTFKIGVINTEAFGDEKAGITKYVSAMKTLESQLKPDFTALQTMNNKLQAMKTELEGYQKQLDDPNLPKAINKAQLQTTAQAKNDEFQKMILEFEYKQKDYKANSERRQQTLTAPISLDIINAIQEFTKLKGYALILDAAKLDGAGLLLGFDEKYDATKEFIAFYNARPASATATAATPK